MPSTLFDYLRQCQRFIRDAKMELVDPGDLIDYVNQARREVAMRAQCIRRLPRIYGSVVSIPIPVVSGWTAPVTVTISPPDSPSGALPFPNGAQAIATATLTGGAISDVEVTYGGDGYFQPQATYADAAGHTETVFAATTVLNTLNEGQEVYPFSGFNLSSFPGCGAVFAIRSVSIIYSNYRYSLPIYSWSTYQSQIRQFSAGQYQYVPTFGSQFGRGTDGSLYMYPLPSQAYQLEVDCMCLPQDLTADESVEAIPDPWTDAVPYFAAHLSFLELQNWNTARGYLELFEKRMRDFGGFALPGRAVNPYGRF
jgi:hypothetical protein